MEKFKAGEAETMQMIEALRFAIAKYQEGIDKGEEYRIDQRTVHYEVYLRNKILEKGLCAFFSYYRTSINLRWIDKYTQYGPLSSNSHYWGYAIHEFTDPKQMTINQMQFCLEVRLQALKWELELQKLKLKEYVHEEEY